MATILIIDDEPFLIMVLKDQFKKMRGHEVIGANTGDEGIKLVMKKMPDLIMLDMGLPDMDGLQIIKLLKANEKTKNIPVIMCTAKDSVSDVDESFRLGAVGYIVKPFSLQRIRDKIDEILGTSSTVR